MSPSYSAPAPNPAPTFASLGVRPLINCQGTYTILSGSRALPQVAEAMLLATEGYVQMDELMEAIGRRLHDLTGAPWGYISSGCAAALCELTCAAIAGGDPEKMARLPDTSGMPNEIIIQHGHRNAYDRAMRAAGGVMVEVESPAELETAFSARTALVFVVGDQAHLGQICTADMIAAAHRHGTPCLVDAAAERPDIPNRYMALGADAVTYSGGKCLRGPQASGLVLGNKALLQAAYLNSAPHHGLGRPMKAGKEEVMGLLAAVEAWVAGRDHAAEWKRWEGWLATIASALAGLPSLITSIE
ncbi:MAG: aminotransferase class V-fold PLP-dependent enzyme, partial [Chloroflexi bacterium]|nr:aminotransferase class V-fold PLP-dependent enzyme [Chloroflexota bacterium]